MIQIDEMENRLDEMTKFFIFSQEEFKSEIDTMLKIVSSNIEEISDARETIKNNKLIINEKNNELTTNKEKYEESINSIEGEYRNNIEKLQNDYETSINTLTERTDFIAAILSAKPSLNKYLLDFDIIVNRDFLKFSNTNKYHAEDAQSLLRLKDIKREIESFVSAPDIYSKSTMAVLSGYESGKSQMLNSFFKSEDLEMPIEYDPAYTIPTYIISDSKSSIKGYNQKGATVDIEQGFYHRLISEHAKSMHFNLEDIMPFVLIRTLLNEKYFKNISLLDIQEFDPKHESQKAIENLKHSTVTSILWVINLDKNLTIPAADLEFLKSLPNKNQKLYIVANIFEKRDTNELKSRLNTIKNSLNNNGIEFIGMSAYRSEDKSEYGYIHKSLFDFIKEQNRPLLIQENLIVKIQDIFEVYRNAIKDTLKTIDGVDKQFDLLELDMKEDGLEDENGIISLRLTILKKLCKEKELQDDFKRVDILQNKFIATINKIFGRDITL